MAKAGMVIGSRGARACDVCGKERARWYCAADEAYLCEKCDASVHSANAVAGRHERVRLGPNGAPMKINRRSTSSGKPKPPNKRIIDPPHPPSSWHPRRRTQITYPRIITTFHSPLLDHHDPPLLLLSAVKSEPNSPPPSSPGRTSGTGIPPVAKVEIDYTDLSHEVPIIEPFLDELISVTSDNLMEQILPSTPSFTNDTSIPCFVDHFLMQSGPGEIDHGDMDEPIEDGSNSIGDVSAIDEFDLMDLCNSSNPENDAAEFDIPTMDMWSTAEELWLFGPNPFKAKGEIQFEVKEEADPDGTVPAPAPSIELCTDHNMEGAEKKKKAFRRTLSLQLNYEDVLTAWSDRGSLWMGGERPQTVPDDSIFESDFEAGLVPEMDHEAGEVPAMERSNTEAAREARVMRYREKRRTRLFSKKIRYEVRKLNAERRPRMKGRFIKRSLPNVGVHLEHL